MSSIRLSLILALALLLSAAASATPTYSTSRTDFTSQLTNTTLLDFNNAYGDYSASGYIQNNIQFVGYKFPSAGVTENWLWVSSNIPPNTLNFGTGGLIYSVDPQYSTAAQPYIMINLPGLNAVGFDLMTYLPGSPATYGKDVDIWITDAVGVYYQRVSTLNRSTTTPPEFFGIISPTPITSIKVQATVGSTLIDNFIFGSPTQLPPGDSNPGETPEVATIVMIGSGLMYFGLRRRRVQRATAAAA